MTTRPRRPKRPAANDAATLPAEAGLAEAEAEPMAPVAVADPVARGVAEAAPEAAATAACPVQLDMAASGQLASVQMDWAAKRRLG